MTRDEFIARAYNPPYEDEPVIYRLSIDTLFYDEDEYPEPYGNARVFTDTFEGYYLSFEDAQREIERRVGDDDTNYYRFIIFEVPIGITDGRGAFKRLWSFDKTGALIYHLPWSNMDKDFERYDRFYGLPDERQRFNVGDVVELYGRDHLLQVGIIDRIPHSPEEIWSRNKHADGTCEMSHNDWMDCNYIVWLGAGEYDWDHVWDIDLMPPTFPDSPQIKELKKAYDNAKSN